MAKIEYTVSIGGSNRFFIAENTEDDDVIEDPTWFDIYSRLIGA